MNASAIIVHEGRELEIEFYYSELIPATYEYPAEGGEFEIYSVKYVGKLKADGSFDKKYRDLMGREIKRFFSQKTIDEISEKYNS